MFTNGAVVKSDSGRQLRIGTLIKAGGQGQAYWATELISGEKGVFKAFLPKFAGRDTLHRLQFLVAQDLRRACPALQAPVDVVQGRRGLGHYAPTAPGAPLEEFLANPTCTLLQGLQLAVALAHAFDVLHQKNIAHGDLHAENVFVHPRGSVLEVYVIDFDNFNAPGMPPPPMVGHDLYMAPELRAAAREGRSAVAGAKSDLYSLGVLMHEIVLLRHVAAGADHDEAAFEKAMCSGRWLHDPASSEKPTEDLGGYPVDVLNADLARLFRRSLSLSGDSRPSAKEWEKELGRALHAIFQCPACGGPCVVDASKRACPMCKKPFPLLKLALTKKRAIAIDSAVHVIGRAELGSSMKVSARHAVLRRIGPETWLESLGRNGTYRWTGTDWIRLPDEKPILIECGDRLKFADVEARAE